MIPKIIHYCWFGDAPLPKKYQYYLSTWRKHCPDYKIVRWTEKNYHLASKNNFVQRAYAENKWGLVTDYARLDILYRYGGIYFDTDVEVLKPLDPLLENQMFVGIEKGGAMIATGLGIGAKKGHPFVKELREQYEQITYRSKGNEIDGNLTCPKIQTPMFQKKYKTNFTSEKIYRFSDCTIYPSSFFCPESYQYGTVSITKDTYTWHHYGGSWLTKGQKINFQVRKTIYHYLGKEMADMVYHYLETIRQKE